MCSPQWLLGHKTEQDCALTHARSSVPVRVCLGQSRRRRSGPDCIMCRRGRRPHGHTVVPRGAAVRTACATHFRVSIQIWNMAALRRLGLRVNCGPKSVRVHVARYFAISARRTATGPVEKHRGRRTDTGRPRSDARTGRAFPARRLPPAGAGAVQTSKRNHVTTLTNVKSIPDPPVTRRRSARANQWPHSQNQTPPRTHEAQPRTLGLRLATIPRPIPVASPKATQKLGCPVRERLVP